MFEQEGPSPRDMGLNPDNQHQPDNPAKPSDPRRDYPDLVARLEAVRNFQISGNIIQDTNEFMRVTERKRYAPLEENANPSDVLKSLIELKRILEDILMDPRLIDINHAGKKLLNLDIPIQEIETLDKIIGHYSPLITGDDPVREGRSPAAQVREEKKKPERELLDEEIIELQKRYAELDIEHLLTFYQIRALSHDRARAYINFIKVGGGDEANAHIDTMQKKIQESNQRLTELSSQKNQVVDQIIEKFPNVSIKQIIDGAERFELEQLRDTILRDPAGFKRLFPDGEELKRLVDGVGLSQTKIEEILREMTVDSRQKPS